MSSEPHSCPECGFVWDGVSRAEAISGINESVAAFVGVIESAGEMALIRPESLRWSIVEYAAHLRDVFISLRERTILASVVNNPTGQPIYRDERVNLGFYALDTIDDSVDGLRFAAELLSKTITALPDGYENRTLVYSPVSNAQVTIGWMAAQGFHEAFHHLLDVRHNLKMYA